MGSIPSLDVWILYATFVIYFGFFPITFQTKVGWLKWLDFSNKNSKVKIDCSFSKNNIWKSIE
jgi:hypothetical protein